MIDKQHLSRDTISVQACYLYREGSQKSEVHTCEVRNVTQPASTLYGEVVIDGELWVVRHLYTYHWTSIGPPIDADDPDKDQLVKSMILDYIEGRI